MPAMGHFTDVLHTGMFFSFTHCVRLLHLQGFKRKDYLTALTSVANFIDYEGLIKS